MFKKFFVLIIVVSVSALAIAQWARYTLQAQPRLPRERWEYCTVNMVTPGSGGWKAQVSRGSSIDNVDSDITGISTVNKLGLEGWEIVSVVHEKGNSVEYFLKRPMR